MLENPNFEEILKNLLSGPLPGKAAQYRMAGLRRLAELDETPIPPANARIAAVLNLLHRQDMQWHTVLIRRTVNPKDRHSGQISFPGGRWEERDEALPQAALREAEEEIGVAPENVRIIGRLTDLYIPVSNYLVHPFVGILLEDTIFRPQPGEVEQILTPPLSLFVDKDQRKVADIPIGPNLSIKQAPYFEVDGHFVWGATAMILSEFAALLQDKPID